MLSESILCYSTAQWFEVCLVLCCVVDSNPYQLVAIVLWVRIPPSTALYFSLEKKSCPGCSWFVCCAYAFLPHSFHMHQTNHTARHDLKRPLRHVCTLGRWLLNKHKWHFCGLWQHNRNTKSMNFDSIVSCFHEVITIDSRTKKHSSSVSSDRYSVEVRSTERDSYCCSSSFCS